MTTDQQGNPRIVGGTVDIGACEANPTASITLSPGPLPAGIVGTSYNQTITASGGGGTLTFRYAIFSGQVPAGLTFNDATPGQLNISGMPTALGAVRFTAIVEDSQGNLAGLDYTLFVPESSTVSNTSNDPTVSGSLPWAVAQADADTTGNLYFINLSPALAGQTITLASTLQVNNTTQGESIEIDGPAGGITIAGGGSGSDFSVFKVAANTSAAINGLTISDGFSGTDGGGIANSGTLNVSNSAFSDNSSAFVYGEGGGGIYNAGSLMVNNSTFSDNSAAEGGGIYNSGGSATVSNSTFSANSAAVLLDGYVFGDGGGIDQSGGTLTLSDSTFTGNTANAEGGGIENISGTMTVSNCTVSGNTDPNNGSGINNGGTLTVSNSTFSDNGGTRYGEGGGIFNDGTLSVSGSTFSGNSGDGGGAIANESSGTMTVTGCSLADNSGSAGGGIYNVGTATLSNSTLTGNSTGSYGVGGAISNTGTMTVTAVTISGNFGDSAGGGIYNYQLTGYAGGTLTVTDSTISNNSATDGGGIDGAKGTTTTISDSTIAYNSATTGGGVDQAGTFNVLSTIIANNTAPTGPDFDGTITAGNHDLVDNGAGMTGLTNNTNGNQVGTSATPIVSLLGPLGNYGGPLQTVGLLANSPALNTGGAVTSLSALIGATDTSIAVGSAAAIASTPGNYVIQIDVEQMLVTSVDLKTNTLTVVRGYNSTTKIGHSKGAGIFLANDERGLPRVVSGQTDIGAYYGTVAQTTPPTATLNATAVSASNAAAESPYTFTTVFQSSTFVAAISIAPATVLVQPPDASDPIGDGLSSDDIAATLVSTVLSGNSNGLGDSQTVTATYRFTPPGGSWAQAANGLYTVALGGTPVTDTSNNGVPTSSDAEGNPLTTTQLGGFQVATSVQPSLNLLSVSNPSEAGHTAGTVTGLGVAGASISVTATDGTTTTSPYTTTVGVDGTWTIGNMNVSGLSDGSITYSAAMTTSAGTQTSTLTATKDTQGTPASMTYYVAPGFGTLQAAIDEAETNDVARQHLDPCRGTI